MSSIDRKFVTWDYRTPDGRSYEGIEIRYKQVSEGAEFPFTFYCNFKCDGYLLKEESGSVEELRQKIVDKLDAFNLIEWKPYLFVSVGPTDMPRTDVTAATAKVCGVGLGLIVHFIERGCDGKGTWYWRETRETLRCGLRARYVSVHKGTPGEGAGAGGDPEELLKTGHALVRDTVEMRTSLLRLMSDFAKLHERLVELMTAEDAAERLLCAKLKCQLVTELSDP
jgi:hypothetical protein